MKSKRFLMTAALSVMLVGAVSAQEDTRDALSSYSFVELQGGVQLMTTNADMTKLMTPTAAISIGRYFSPVIGARLHVNAWQSKSGFSDIDKYYKWKYVTPSVDLLLNLTNLISKNESGSHPLNVIALAGFGLSYAWDNKELKDLNLSPLATPFKWDDNRLSHNLRLGARLETDVTKLVGVSLEVNANSVSDRINSKTNNASDWQFTAMLGLSVRFGKRYSKPTPLAVPVVEEFVEQNTANVAPAAVVVKEKKKKEVTKEAPVKLHVEAFYELGKADNATPASVFTEVANFMKENQNVKVTIVGYADKETGTAKKNMTLSEERAKQFKDKLVKEFGADASRITTAAKGDTVQPFDVNDKNRCVLIDAEGVRVYKEIIEVEE
jgi:outer membrane protein OmpA-like peptidoglycan-associated protein